jgi:hypothetical protein
MPRKQRDSRGSASDDSVPALIRTIRGQKVILDADLEDFRFQLTREEFENLISQIAISSAGGPSNSSQTAMSLSQHGGRRKFPWAFTEHGALMAANILNSPRAVEMSVFVIRAFVRMREALATNAAILKRLAEIDRTLLVHDTALRDLYGKLRPLLSPPPEPEKPKIGFHPGNR